jgi:hypothetical protein
MTEICYLVLPAHAIQAEQVRLKSMYNEGNFILDAESVFPLYVTSHSNAVIEIDHIAFLAHE